MDSTRILVVDDCPVPRKLLRKKILRLGFACDESDSGEKNATIKDVVPIYELRYHFGLLFFGVVSMVLRDTTCLCLIILEPDQPVGCVWCLDLSLVRWQALELAKRLREGKNVGYSIIFMDQDMSGTYDPEAGTESQWQGHNAVSELRRSGFFCPIIMCTSNTIPESVGLYFDSGANAVLPKENLAKCNLQDVINSMAIPALSIDTSCGGLGSTNKVSRFFQLAKASSTRRGGPCGCLGCGTEGLITACMRERKADHRRNKSCEPRLLTGGNTEEQAVTPLEVTLRPPRAHEASYPCSQYQSLNLVLYAEGSLHHVFKK
ncbi:hypothetical protein AAMO2058_000226600 [Amorphochlora amoebiformis]